MATRKAAIPASLRISVWNSNVGSDVMIAKCYVGCGCAISFQNFECGHIKASASGGSDDLENLKPICSTCNKSMGTKNMLDFIKANKFAPEWLAKMTSNLVDTIELPNCIGVLEPYDFVELPEPSQLTIGTPEGRVHIYKASKANKTGECYTATITKTGGLTNLQFGANRIFVSEYNKNTLLAWSDSCPVLSNLHVSYSKYRKLSNIVLALPKPQSDYVSKTIIIGGIPYFYDAIACQFAKCRTEQLAEVVWANPPRFAILAFGYSAISYGDLVGKMIEFSVHSYRFAELFGILDQSAQDQLVSANSAKLISMLE
jgi:hypothetical protein